MARKQNKIEGSSLFIKKTSVKEIKMSNKINMPMTDSTQCKNDNCKYVGLATDEESKMPSDDALMFVRLFARAYDPMQTVA